MKKSKLSTKSLLEELSYKKYLKNRETIELGELKICKEDFDIENLGIIGSNNTNTVSSKTSRKGDIKRKVGLNNLKDLLDHSSSCQISDALSQIAKRDGVIKGLKSINRQKAYGRIVTVKTQSDDWGTSLLGIDEAQKGNILFIETRGPISAIWGELTSSCSKEKKLSGTFIWGATRDIDFVSSYEYPVFARETTSNAGSPLGLGQINIPLEIKTSTGIFQYSSIEEKNEKNKNKENQTNIPPTISNYENIITINPGDFIYGDNSGVVHVPQELFCEVMMKTLEIKIKEANILSEIKKGKSLSEIVGLK